MVVLFDRARSFGRDAHGAVREEGDTRLASQISRINPGDQWGDRCRSQIVGIGVKQYQEKCSALEISLSYTHLGTEKRGMVLTAKRGEMK